MHALCFSDELHQLQQFATEPLQKIVMFSLSHLIQVELKLYKIEIVTSEIDEIIQDLKSDPTKKYVCYTLIMMLSKKKKYVDKKRISCCMS